MQVCPNCNHLNRPASKFCVKCGRPVKRKNKLVLPILIAAGLIVVMLMVSEVLYLSISNPYQYSSSTTKPDSWFYHDGQITRVIDGDTLLIDQTTIRLSLVDSPERGQPGYQDAKDFVSTICPVGSNAEFVEDWTQPTDRYGRSLGLVYCNDMLLNKMLLTNNHAEILLDFCHKSAFGTEDWAMAYGCRIADPITHQPNDDPFCVGENYHESLCGPP